MNKKLMAVLGALSLVACGGSGKEWDGDGSAPDVGGGWPTTGIPVGDVGGSTAVGGSNIAGSYDVGGGYGVAGTGVGVGGNEVGGGYDVGSGGTGCDMGSGYGVAGAGVDVGGNEAGGSYSVGGTGIAVGGSGGSAAGPQDPLCWQNVVHCFDAASNCFQYSPTSDCDQIVDLCAAMQTECNE
jgi:hypothetical protein